ncbi:unnamed protein product [Caenorhabditis brenneri]
MRTDAEYARRCAEEELQRADSAVNPAVQSAPPLQPTTPHTNNSTTAECLICYEVPVTPRGCRSCLNYIGCESCCFIRAQRSAQPSCPLCRGTMEKETLSS